MYKLVPIDVFLWRLQVLLSPYLSKKPAEDWIKEYDEVAVEDDESGIPMFEFFEKKGYKFENGKVYHEVSKESEQDLQYYKQIIHFSSKVR